MGEKMMEVKVFRASNLTEAEMEYFVDTVFEICDVVLNCVDNLEDAKKYAAEALKTAEEIAARHEVTALVPERVIRGDGIVLNPVGMV